MQILLLRLPINFKHGGLSKSVFQMLTKNWAHFEKYWNLGRFLSKIKFFTYNRKDFSHA